MVTGSGNIRKIQTAVFWSWSDYKNLPIHSPNVTAEALDKAIPILKSMVIVLQDTII